MAGWNTEIGVVRVPRRSKETMVREEEVADAKRASAHPAQETSRVLSDH
jgi:hypothetical protein